tara:strand:+ start:298 stop:840 length:543 start_codon:yes stop_codon:yes gene_type:complete
MKHILSILSVFTFVFMACGDDNSLDSGSGTNDFNPNAALDAIIDNGQPIVTAIIQTQTQEGNTVEDTLTRNTSNNYQFDIAVDLTEAEYSTGQVDFAFLITDSDMNVKEANYVKTDDAGDFASSKVCENFTDSEEAYCSQRFYISNMTQNIGMTTIYTAQFVDEKSQKSQILSFEFTVVP